VKKSHHRKLTAPHQGDEGNHVILLFDVITLLE